MVAGGNTANGFKDTTYYYDVVGDAWTSGNAMSEQRYGHICKLITLDSGDQKVLAVGGIDWNGASIESMDIYDVTTKAWTSSILTWKHAQAFKFMYMCVFSCRFQPTHWPRIVILRRTLTQRLLSVLDLPTTWTRL